AALSTGSSKQGILIRLYGEKIYTICVTLLEGRYFILYEYNTETGKFFLKKRMIMPCLLLFVRRRERIDEMQLPF
ncbi:MAG: hypothetical protein IKY33_00990, partial [Clostridia bacterium]|nr:hypothetical protein [Clostridia bacterium]